MPPENAPANTIGDNIASNLSSQNDGATSSDSTGKDDAPAYVTEDALAAVLQKYNSDMKSDFGRQLKQLQESVTSLVKPEKKSDSAEPKDKTQQQSTDGTLRERLAQLEKKDARQQARALRIGIRDALVKNGADPRLAEMTVPALLEMNKDHLQVSESEFGDFKVAYDGDTIDTWAKVFMSSDDGKLLGASKAAPNLDLPRDQGTDPQTGKTTVPYSKLSDYSTEDLLSGRIVAVPG